MIPTTLTRFVRPLAQWNPGPYGPHHGPHWGGGMWGGSGMGSGMGGGTWGAGPAGGLGFPFGWLLLVVLAGVLVAAVVYLRREGDDPARDAALNVLRERYATGDLSDEEFERRRARLTGDDAPTAPESPSNP